MQLHFSLLHEISILTRRIVRWESNSKEILIESDLHAATNWLTLDLVQTFAVPFNFLWYINDTKQICPKQN